MSKTKSNIAKWYGNHSKHIMNGFKWFCLIILLALAIRFVNIEKAKSAFLQISISIFILYICILFFSKVLYALRWKIINRALIHKKNIPISYFFSTNLLAEFVTIALPSSIGGEVTRFMKINRHNQDAILTTTGIFIDRLIGIISMAITSIAVLLIIGQEIFIDLNAFFTQDYFLPILVGALITGGLIIYGLFRWVKTKDFTKKIKTAWVMVHQNRLSILLAAIISIVAHILFSVSHVTIFQRLFPLPVLSVIGVILTPHLARSIPISLFGISGGEGLMVISQMMVGMPQSTALVITLISLIARYFFALTGLLLELITDGRKFLNILRNKTKD